MGIKPVHNVFIQLQKTPNVNMSSWSYTPSVWPWTALMVIIFVHFDMCIYDLNCKALVVLSYNASLLYRSCTLYTCIYAVVSISHFVTSFME